MQREFSLSYIRICKLLNRPGKKIPVKLAQGLVYVALQMGWDFAEQRCQRCRGVLLQRTRWIITLQGLSVWGHFPAQLFCTSFARHSCIRIKKFCSELTRLRSVWINNCLFVNCKELQCFKFTHYFNPTSSILPPPPSEPGLKKQKHSCSSMLSEFFCWEKEKPENHCNTENQLQQICFAKKPNQTKRKPKKTPNK